MKKGGTPPYNTRVRRYGENLGFARIKTALVEQDLQCNPGQDWHKDRESIGSIEFFAHDEPAMRHEVSRMPCDCFHVA